MVATQYDFLREIPRECGQNERSDSKRHSSKPGQRAQNNTNTNTNTKLPAITRYQQGTYIGDFNRRNNNTHPHPHLEHFSSFNANQPNPSIETKLGTRRRTRTVKAQSTKPCRGYGRGIHSFPFCVSLACYFQNSTGFPSCHVVMRAGLLLCVLFCVLVCSRSSHPCSAYKLCPIFLLAFAPQRHGWPILALAIEHLAATRKPLQTSTPSGTKAVCWIRSRALCTVYGMYFSDCNKGTLLKSPLYTGFLDYGTPRDRRFLFVDRRK